jgi:hypothetical protein
MKDNAGLLLPMPDLLHYRSEEESPPHLLKTGKKSEQEVRPK